MKLTSEDGTVTHFTFDATQIQRMTRHQVRTQSVPGSDPIVFHYGLLSIQITVTTIADDTLLSSIRSIFEDTTIKKYRLYYDTTYELVQCLQLQYTTRAPSIHEVRMIFIKVT